MTSRLQQLSSTAEQKVSGHTIEVCSLANVRVFQAFVPSSHRNEATSTRQTPVVCISFKLGFHNC